MENLYPPPSPPPPIKDGKLARFGFCAASSLICGGGGGWGFAVPFYSVQDCRCSQPRREDGHDVVHE